MNGCKGYQKLLRLKPYNRRRWSDEEFGEVVNILEECADVGRKPNSPRGYAKCDTCHVLRECVKLFDRLCESIEI
jgi:hypothetical protein